MDMSKLRRTNLKQCYKYVYNCNRCHNKYGSDEKESIKICPLCDRNFKEGKMSLLKNE